MAARRREPRCYGSVPAIRRKAAPDWRAQEIERQGGTMNRATRSLCGCAPVQRCWRAAASEVRREPVELAAAAGEQGCRFSNGGDVEAMPESATRRIAAGTEFIVVGRVAQGLVLKPMQTVLTVEGAHARGLRGAPRRPACRFLPAGGAPSRRSSLAPMPLQERDQPMKNISRRLAIVGCAALLAVCASGPKHAEVHRASGAPAKAACTCTAAAA